MELRPHWMVFQVECGNIKKRKAFCLRVTDGNEQHVHRSKEYQSLFCKVSNYNGYDWIEDETVPAGWKSWVIGSSGKEYIFRPDGKQFMTSALLSSTWLNTLQHWVMITVCQEAGFTGLRKISTSSYKVVTPISVPRRMK